MATAHGAVRADEPRVAVSVVVPTYRREGMLLDTLDHLLGLRSRAVEILVVDQTPSHEPETRARLGQLDREGDIRWLRLERPSIPGAMNAGLLRAIGEVVLFLDDDVVPDPDLVGAHWRAHAGEGVGLVAGRVLQPWDEVDAGPAEGPTRRRTWARRSPVGFRFSSTRRCWASEFVGCNFSVKRILALRVGGFDENFVHAAYRYERDFADRLMAAGSRILFEPAASIRHLKAPAGGIRAYGDYLRTARPSHAVGEYYYLLRRQRGPKGLSGLLGRPIRAVATRHHARRPWHITATLTAEFLGFLWAVGLAARGPRYLREYDGADES